MTLPRRLPKERRRDANSRIRSVGHLRFVRGHVCAVNGCGNRGIEAAHVRCGTGGGTSLKPGDDWTISLCRDHHAEQHRIGEPAFEKKYGIDMKALAQEFAAKSPALRRARQSGER